MLIQLTKNIHVVRLIQSIPFKFGSSIFWEVQVFNSCHSINLRAQHVVLDILEYKAGLFSYFITFTPSRSWWGKHVYKLTSSFHTFAFPWSIVYIEHNHWIDVRNKVFLDNFMLIFNPNCAIKTHCVDIDMYAIDLLNVKQKCLYYVCDSRTTWKKPSSNLARS